MRLTNLSRRVVQVQEEERRRLAIDLHDSAGTSLAAVQLNLMSIKNALRGSTPKASEVLAETIALIAEVIANVRDICGELRPSVLDYVGLSPALETCAKNFDERTDMTVRFAQDPAIGRLPPDLESVLYRIAQEALTNCAKHASAMRVDLRLSASDGLVTFTITDDGSGFDLASVAHGAKAPGLGLLSMRERAEFMGGTLTVDSVPGKGTRITVELPTRDETRADSAAVSG